MSDSPRPLDQLQATIRQRAADADAGASWTAKLLAGGVERIGPKVTEEAGELVEAASEPGDAGRQHFVYEAADLLYHAMVLCHWRGVSLEEVEEELARRFGMSGIAEKASRPQADAGKQG